MRRLAPFVILGIGALISSGCDINTSPGRGEKIGQVVKLSKVGIISKTWEGQIIRGGMSGGNGSFGTVPFDFTVEDEDVADSVKKHMENQTEILLSYRTEFIYSLFRSESQGHFLTRIQEVPKKN